MFVTKKSLSQRRPAYHVGSAASVSIPSNAKKQAVEKKVVKLPSKKASAKKTNNEKENEE